jgi:hypothetical protein
MSLQDPLALQLLTQSPWIDHESTWSEFEQRTSRFTHAPDNRAAADRTIGYAQNDRFVDFLNELLLRAADENVTTIPRIYARLTLIQRAHANDVSTLFTLCSKARNHQRRIELMSTYRLIGFYPEHTQLQPVATQAQLYLHELAAQSPEMEFAAELHLPVPEEKPWSLLIECSTAPHAWWIARKNSLKPEDMRLTLNITSPGWWSVELRRRDDLFKVKWSKDGIAVSSEQLRYRRLSWPTLRHPLEFPQLAAQLNDLLAPPFLREAHLTAAPDLQSVDTLQLWLSAVCDQLT